MNIKRITTALLGVTLVILILVLGNEYVIDVTFAAIAAICLHEYFNSFKGKANPVIWIGYLSSAAIAFIHIIPIEYSLNIIGIFIVVLVFLLFMQIILSKMKTNINDISITLFGICYISLFLMFIPLIRGMENGQYLVWYVFAGAWGTDVFAYFVGVNLGKHKFSKISPNKSIEGCIGGILGSIAFMLFFTYIFNTFTTVEISYVTTIIVAIILSVFAQIGDFAASTVKRYVGINDFSNLIPGHGGMLDRFDSVIFIAPIAYFLIQYVLIAF